MARSLYRWLSDIYDTAFGSSLRNASFLDCQVKLEDENTLAYRSLIDIYIYIYIYGQ